MRKSKQGFTLVELIIAIAIVAILTAVLIPTISGYITKAKRGKDVELAGQMTSELSLYATEYNVNLNDLTGVDIRTILSFNGHSLVPRKDKWVFLYDRVTRKIFVKDLDNGLLVFSEGETDPGSPYDPIDPTHIHENYFLISKGKNNFEKAINLMTNLRMQEDANKNNIDFEAAKALAGSDYLPVIEYFDPKETMFIDNSGAYTQATIDEPATKIVILEQTSCLPIIDDEIFSRLSTDLLTGNKIYSNTVRMSEPESKLKQVFKGVPDIDYTKIKPIDLPAFGSHKDGDAIYKLDMGPYFKESFKQVISDEILSIIRKDEDKLVINRKVTVSYYNKDGLFARGSVNYAVLQSKPEIE